MSDYKVTGMSCSACVRHVEKAVKSVPGVTDVNVSLLMNQMSVEGDVKEKDIIKAVKKAGYGAKPINNKSKNETTNESSENENSNETRTLLHRFLVSLVFLLILMYFSMGHTMFGFYVPKVLKSPLSLGIIEMVLSLIILYINRVFFTRGFKAALHLSTNMDTLVALGSSASFIYSFISLLIVYYLSSHGEHESAMNFAHTHYYFESAAMIPTLITIGKTLESYSKGRTTDALKSLKELAPLTATVEVDGIEKEIPLSEVCVDDILIIRPGERIPVDGIIIEGETSIDESSLTGESIPIDASTGDVVKSSTTSVSGFIKIKATNVGDDTTLAKIIKLVSEASASKAPIARIADQVSGIFVPTVIIISIATLIGWMIYGIDFQKAFSRAVSVLVISCPCALGLATPVAIMVGNGIGAKNGILFKNATSLENAGKIQTVVLDKTGTITKGMPEVTDVVSPLPDSDFLRIAALLEDKSSHPLGIAIKEYAINNNVDYKAFSTSEFKNHAGNGISATINNKHFFAGKLEFIEDSLTYDSIETQKLLATAEILRSEGKTVTYFSEDGNLIGIIALFDTIKPDSRAAILELKKLGIHVCMLTGDNNVTADTIAKDCEIDETYSDVLPDEKEAIIRKLKETSKVAMVGDGINDAPSLTSADIGIAIGAGSDIALDSCDIVLEKNSLLDVSKAIRISKATLRNIKENLFWAFFYNIICIPLAIGLYQAIFNISFEMKPMIGALAMSLSSVTVCLNALRLNLIKFKS